LEKYHATKQAESCKGRAGVARMGKNKNKLVLPAHKQIASRL
jgi:hypothetical protein